MSYLHILHLVAPESVMVVTALVLLAADLLALGDVAQPFRSIVCALICCGGCVAAAGLILVVPEHGNLFSGLFVSDSLTQLVKVVLLALTVFTALLSTHSDFTEHIGEYFALLLFATIGMMFLVSSEDILMIFVSLELTSLSLYILTAFNKRNIKSAEAALKYFLFGGMAAAFTLFGLSLLYGMTGSTSLVEIAKALGTTAIHSAGGKPGLDPLLMLALVMTVIGFGFKIAAVPFHLWAPDAYEGAPIPSAALIASGSKLASFFILAKVMMIGFAGAEGSGAFSGRIAGWVPLLSVLSVLSLVLGNLAAIAQRSVRRLLAYSAIAHAGYILLGIMAHNGHGLVAVVYYASTYGLTVVGAFGVVGVLQRGGGGDNLSDFAGLSRRAPLLAFCLLLFFLSLAGIPPLAGFFGKFYLFFAALRSDTNNLALLWLVALALALSAVSLYYYLQVLKQAYVVPAPSGFVPLRIPAVTQVALVLLALGVLILGCFPQLLLGPLSSAVRAAGFAL